jgi:integrase
MQNILRRGGTYYARLFIPADRWADVGKARGASGGITREVVRSLQTGDLREARKRLRPALAAIQADVDAKLAAAGRRPLTEWSASWTDRALFLREALQSASDDKVIQGTTHRDSASGEEVFLGDTERDLLLDAIGEETAQLAKLQGDAVAASFRKAVTADSLSLHEASARWLAEQTGARRLKTIEGHKRVLKLLDGFLRECHELPSLVSTTFNDVTRRMAGEFIAWRVAQVSPAAVKREASTMMGLWRWGVRRGHTDLNPWVDQTAGLRVSADNDEDTAKRAFTVPEVVTLLRATGSDWAPNGGGYGATLWDATRLALLSGLRAGELADLRVRDVIEGGTAVSIRRGKTKNAPRLVPLPKVAQRVLAARLASLPDHTPDAPLWPEIPFLGLTNSRGGKLSDRFRKAKERLLPKAEGVDMHSLRRSYATMLEAAMNAGGKSVTGPIIATLMGHARGTMALDRYSSGPVWKAAQAAVADLETLGIPAEVATALAETQGQRPAMVRLAPATGITTAPTKAAPTKRVRVAHHGSP